MQDIKRIAILGAGALGASYAGKFFDSDNFLVSLVAGGKRYEKLKNTPLIINDKPYILPVIHPDEATPPADLIIVALKHHHLTNAITDLRNIVGDQTTIISVLNGLDSETDVGAVYGLDKLLYTIALGMDALREGNNISYTTLGKLVFGEADNTQLSRKVQQVQAAFDRAGIIHETPVDMLRVLWWKFMVNVGVNQSSAALQAPYGILQTVPDAQALMEDLMREVILLSQHAGVNLTEKDLEDWYPVLNTLSPDGKTSMLQDIDAGRKTEVEIFAGKVVELGKSYGIPTPTNRALLHIIRVLERHSS
jgi:2-dehydropantoate 2-reductase